MASNYVIPVYNDCGFSNSRLLNEREIKMMKKIFALMMLSASLITTTVLASDESEFYKELVERENIGTIQECWSDELTGEMLENRGNSLIIEKIIGVVVDDDLNGNVLNASDYDYISYASVNGATKGDVILTLLIYNPGNNYIDDIVDRFDYVIDHLQ